MRADVRGTNLIYRDGTQAVEIWVDRQHRSLFFDDGRLRDGVELKIEDKLYMVGLLSTLQNDYVRIGADLKDETGGYVRLVEVLSDLGYRKNEEIELNVVGGLVEIAKKR